MVPFLLSWLVGLECGCLPFFLCLNTLFAAYLVDLSQEISDVIEANDNNYLKDKYVINISDTKKLILTYINLKYNKDTKIVDYYNIDAYLLVK